ncbi:hypothetical protein BDL97_13G030500 [Sphagnum fallax]|nr:hypothetical protein BDL97_13G030500 [Sphagnum fallax]
MAGTKVLLLLGAGATTGSVVLHNTKVSELLNDVTKVLARHMREDGDGSSGNAGGGGEDTFALAAQVQRLTQELRSLASSSRSITVVNETMNSNMSSLTSLVVPVAVVGAVGYCYMWWKGYAWMDFMYVTRKHMSSAVASVSKQLEHVSAALQTTKRQLTSKLDSVTKVLEENVEIQGLIKDQVTEVRSEVERATVEIEEVQRLVEGLEVKIDAVQGKQDFANQGIVLLCRYAASLQMFQQPELLQGFRSWSSNVRSPLEGSTSSSAGASSAAAGLKELQHFSEVLAAETDNREDMVNDAVNFGAKSSGSISQFANLSTHPNESLIPTPVSKSGSRHLTTPAVRRTFSIMRPFGIS